MSSPEASDDEILQSYSSESPLPDRNSEPAVTTSSGHSIVTTVDRISGFKRKSGEDFEDAYGKKPQVTVSVRSDTIVSPDVEQQMGSIVESEIEKWIPGDIEEGLEREVVIRIQDQMQQSLPDCWSMEGQEVVRREVGPTSTVGPICRQHVEVETNLEVETTPVVLTEEEAEKTEFTRKRTWRTTTRETTTSVKKETRTELEVFVAQKTRRTGDYFPDGQMASEKLEIQVRSRSVLTGTMPATSRALEPDGSGKHTELVIVEGEVLSQPEPEEEIKRANEEICLKIENALGHKGRYVLSFCVFCACATRNTAVIPCHRSLSISKMIYGIEPNTNL